MKKERISFYLPNLDGGGAERVMINLANNLIEQNYEVELILTKNQGKYNDFLNDKISVIDLNCLRVSHSLFKLVRVINNRKPKIIISALNHANIIVSLANLLSMNKSSHVMTVHNTIFKKNSLLRTILFSCL